MNAMRLFRMLLVVWALTLGVSASAFSLSGWNCQGTCGTSGADGDVPLAPVSGSAAYGWISTYDSSVTGLALPGLGGAGKGTNGTTIRSGTFAASSGQALSFYFNYISSDGDDYNDYAWARLLDGNGNQVALLFTARTAPSGNTVPGFGLPALAPGLVLSPPSTTAVIGAPVWTPLGTSSGTCYSPAGCGRTGWVKASYTIPAAGTYILEFGVVNWDDEAYDSGLAFDGVTVGSSVSNPTTPSSNEPQTGWWWNAAESGRGFALERRGDVIFLASFLYTDKGRDVWYAGAFSKGASGFYVGELREYQGGGDRTFNGASKGPSASIQIAPATLNFSANNSGYLSFTINGSSHTIPITRFVFAGGSVAPASLAGFESGWWWNPSDSGHGYFIEVQGNDLFGAVYTYNNVSGLAQWYTLQGKSQAGGGFNSLPVSWFQGGQSLVGPYRPPSGPNAAAIASFSLTSPTTGKLTFTNAGQTVSIDLQRFIFQ